MTARFRPRAGGHARRTKRVRRASSGLSPVRAGAALAMLLSAAAIYGLSASSAFGFDPARLRVDGLHYTDGRELASRLGVGPGANLVSLSTEPLAARARELSTVASVEVAVELPDTLAIRVQEAEPILIWALGDRRYLVDRDGVLFAEAPGVGAPALPTMTDRRLTSGGLVVGARLDPIDLDAATRLGSVRPADVGSAAASLGVAVTDDNGFVVQRAAPGGWTAVFGFYTPTLRPPALIAGQVRLLRSLLAGREEGVDRVVLASDTSGTYVARPSARPTKSPRP